MLDDIFWLLQTWARGGWISKLALIVAHCGSPTRLLPPCHSCFGVLSCCGIMGGDSRKRRKSLGLDYNVMEGGCGFNVWMVSLIGYAYDPRELYAYGMTYLGRWPLVNWWMADDVGQWVGCQPMPAEVKSIVFAAAASAGGLCAWILYAAWIPSTSASFAHSAELGWLLGIISGLGDAGWDWDNPSVGIRSGLGMLDGSLYPSFDCQAQFRIADGTSSWKSCIIMAWLRTCQIWCSGEWWWRLYFKLLGCTVKVWGPLIQTAFNCGPSGWSISYPHGPSIGNFGMGHSFTLPTIQGSSSESFSCITGVVWSGSLLWSGPMLEASFLWITGPIHLSVAGAFQFSSYLLASNQSFALGPERRRKRSTRRRIKRERRRRKEAMEGCG